MTDNLTVRVRRLRPGAMLPRRATEHSSGYDLYACTGGEQVEIGQTPVMVPTGVALEVPPGYDAQIRPRSGLARRGVIATFGTLDADYRGELMVTLYTTSPGITHVIQDGDRIAQLVLAALVEADFVEAEALSATARGERGHGSTGR